MLYIKVNKQVLDKIQSSFSAMAVGEEFASAIMDAAAFHANQVLGAIPESAQGKVHIEISDASEAGGGETQVVVSYQPKGGEQASTLQGGRMFLPVEKLGFGSTKRTVVSRGGEEGIYLTGIKKTGRPSMEGWLMSAINMPLEDINSRTLAAASESVRAAVRLYLTANGVVFNESIDRWQAGTGGLRWPSGEYIPGGRIISGAF